MMAGADTFQEDAPAGGGFVPDAEPEPEQPNFLMRGLNAIGRGIHAVGHVGFGKSPLVAAFEAAPGHRLEAASTALKENLGRIAEPEKRREFVRGLGDVATLGYGNQLAARVGNALGDRPEVALGPETFGGGIAGSGGAPVPNTQAADLAAAPEYRAAGQVAASFLPNPASAVANGMTRYLVAPAVKAAAPGAAAVMSKLASVPYAGAALATGAAGVGGAARGLASYELTAPLASGLSAGAAGHRLEAAKEAATDPAGLLLSGGLGAVPAMAGEAVNAAERYVAKAGTEADKWLISDIKGRYKGDTTPTARKYLAADEADVVSTVNADPELRAKLGAARHGDRKALEAASTAVEDKIHEVNAPRAAAYGQVNADLGGGIRSGDWVHDLGQIADDMRAGGTPGGHKMANWIDGRIAEIKASKDWGGNTSVFHPEEKVSGGALDGMKAGDAIKLLSRTPGTEPEIARIREGATTIGFDPNVRVPTQTVRRYVSDVQDAAYDGLGGLADTRAAGQSRHIAAETLGVLNKYLDVAAGKSPESAAAVDQIREINTAHSALKNIQRVVDQRLGKAVEGAAGAAGPMSVKNAFRVLAHSNATLLAAERAYHGHYLEAAGIVGLQAAPAIKRAMDIQAARLGGNPRYQAAVVKVAQLARAATSAADFVSQAVDAGMGAADARRIYEAAHP